MRNFEDTFVNFIGELKNSILRELDEDNQAYNDIKSEKGNYYKQLQNITPPDLLDDYYESQYALSSFELDYCYLCGWRYTKKVEFDNPTSKDILRELDNYEKYRQLREQTSEKYNALQAELSPENIVLLNKYVNSWDLVAGLENQYCYIGGVFDKAKLDKYFSFANTNTWEKLINNFLQRL